jgi:hypothetical protein
MSDPDENGPPPPPPPPRKAVPMSTAPPAVADNDDQSESVIAVLQRQIADLVLVRAKHEQKIASQQQDINSLKRLVNVEKLLIGEPNGSTSAAAVSSPAFSPSSCEEMEMIADREMLFRLQTEQLTKQGEELMQVLTVSQANASKMEAEMGGELVDAQKENVSLRHQLEAIRNETQQLKERVADDILLRVERNRLEIAAKRVSAPRVSRHAGLRRLEALERNAMQAHDDQFYVQQFASAAAPVRNTTLALVYFSVKDVEEELRHVAPEMVGFVQAVVHTTMAAIAEERGAYRIAQWGTFAAFAFGCPLEGLQFACSVQQQLHSYDWPDPVVHAASMAIIPNPNAASSGLAALRRQQRANTTTQQVSPNVFAGPRLRVSLHHCTPSTDINPHTGRTIYFGKEVHAALVSLALCARPGEIIANVDWAQALLRMSENSPSGGSSEACLSGNADRSIHLSNNNNTQIQGGGAAYFAALIKEQLKRNHIDVEERSVTLERPPPIKMVQRHHAVNFATSSTNGFTPTTKDIATLTVLSLLPLSLASRRDYFVEATATASGVSVARDEELALIALGSRVMNGRALEQWNRHSRDDLARWGRCMQQRKMILSRGPAEAQHRDSLAAGTPATQALLLGTTTIASPQQSTIPHASPAATGKGGSGLAARHRKSSVQSNTPLPPVRTRASLAAQDSPSRSAAPSVVAANSGDSGAVPSTLSHTASISLVAPAATIHSPVTHALLQMLPPLDPPTSSTLGISSAHSKLYFNSQVAQRIAQTFENTAMAAEDRLLVNVSASFSTNAPPTAFVTCDIVGSAALDAMASESVLASATRVARTVALHRGGYLIAQNNEVFSFAFRNVTDAFFFAVNLHGRMRTEVLPKKGSGYPAEVGWRCGISTGSCSQFRPVRSAEDAVGDRNWTLQCRCFGVAPQESGAMCAVAQSWEIIATSAASDSFQQNRRNLLSAEFRIVQKGAMVVKGGGSQARMLYAVIPSADRTNTRLLQPAQQPLPSLQQPQSQLQQQQQSSQAQGSHRLATPKTAPSKSIGNASMLSQRNGSIFNQSLVTPMGASSAFLGGTFAGTISDEGSMNSAAPCVIENPVSLEYQKIRGVLRHFCSSRTTAAATTTPFLSVTGPSGTVEKLSLEAQQRLQKVERCLMMQFDPLVGDVCPVVSSSSKEVTDDRLAQSSMTATLTNTATTTLAAILYVDIEGTAKLLESCPESFVRCQMAANKTLMDVVRSRGGYITKTNGYEAALVAFSRLEVALEAAIVLQQSLLLVEWPSDLLKQEKALRVRDVRTSTMLFNGLRCRVGLAWGPTAATFYPTRCHLWGTTVTEAVLLGRSTWGGCISLSPDAYEYLTEKLRSPITSQLATRALRHQNKVICLESVPIALASRLHKVPASLERYLQISITMEREAALQVWWRNPASGAVKLEVAKLVARRKSTVLSTTSEGFRQMSSASSAGVNGAIVAERLSMMDAVLAAVCAQHDSSKPTNIAANGAMGGTAAPASSSSSSPGAAVTAAQLAAVLRSITSLLQGMSSSSADPRAFEEACRAIHVPNAKSNRRGVRDPTPSSASNSPSLIRPGSSEVSAPRLPPTRPTNAKTARPSVAKLM